MLQSIISLLWPLLWQMMSQTLTAVATLASAILGPIATIRTGKRQARAATLSVNRLAWAIVLRDDVAELIARRIEWLRVIRLRDDRKPEYTDRRKAQELGERIRLLHYRTELRLDPADADHKALITLIQTAPILIPHLNAALNEKIMAATRKICRTEWDRAARVK